MTCGTEHATLHHKLGTLRYTDRVYLATAGNYILFPASNVVELPLQCVSATIIQSQMSKSVLLLQCLSLVAVAHLFESAQSSQTIECFLLSHLKRENTLFCEVCGCTATLPPARLQSQPCPYPAPSRQGQTSAQYSPMLLLLTNGMEWDNGKTTPCVDNRLTCAKNNVASSTFDAFFTQSSTGKRQSLPEDVCSSSTNCTCQAAKNPSPPCQMYARTASPNPSRHFAKKLSSQFCSKCLFVAWSTGFHLQITPSFHRVACMV